MFDAGAARKFGDTFFEQGDRRADGGARRVRVTRSDILIARRFGGVDMMISVPVPAYRGVALDVSEGRDGAPCYRLSIAHRDADLDVLLVETRDGGIAAAEWKHWAAWLDLPRVTLEDGVFSAVDAISSSPMSVQRRRNLAVAKRRPRFLTRRKAGDMARTEEVYAGEREIVCYE